MWQSNDVSPIMSRAFVSHLSISCHFYWKENFVHTYSCMNLSTQGSNSGLPHCRQSLYCLSHQRSPCMFPVQPLSRVRLFVTPWIAACQDSLSITNSSSLLKLMSIESMMPSNHLIFCCPLQSSITLSKSWDGSLGFHPCQDIIRHCQHGIWEAR